MFRQLSRVTVQATGHLLLISIQMYWSLAWSPEQSQGSAGKVILGESDTTSSSDPSKCLVACSIFNGSQGGRLSRCHRIIMYMYFYSGFWYPDVFDALNVLLLIFLVVLNVCTVNKVSLAGFYPILALSSTGFAFFTFYCIFGASGVNSSFCGVGSILTPVSWGFQRFVASSEVPQH